MTSPLFLRFQVERVWCDRPALSVQQIGEACHRIVVKKDRLPREIEQQRLSSRPHAASIKKAIARAAAMRPCLFMGLLPAGMLRL